MILPLYQYRLNITERGEMIHFYQKCLEFKTMHSLAGGLVATLVVVAVVAVVVGLMDDQEPDQVLSEQMLVRNPTPAVSGPTHWISSSEQKLDFGLLNFIS